MSQNCLYPPPLPFTLCLDGFLVTQETQIFYSDSTPTNEDMHGTYTIYFILVPKNIIVQGTHGEFKSKFYAQIEFLQRNQP